MFEKFGEFDSAAEINRCAAAQLAEGDTDAIYSLAEENGIDKYDAEDFINGDSDELTVPLLAAVGKLDIEVKALSTNVMPDILADWIMMIKGYCREEDAFASAVRRKGKSLAGCIEKLMKWSLQNAKEVPKEICKACGITYTVKLGIPGSKKARELIREFYLEDKA